MKKFAFIALLSVSVLTIAGCGRTRAQDGKLPSGGTQVDIYSEEGKKELLNVQTGMAEKYASSELNSFGVDLSLKDINYSTELSNFNMGGALSGPASASIKIKNLGANLAVKLAKSAEGNIDASANLDGVKGNFEVKANVPHMAAEEGNDVNIDASLDISGATAAAYYKGEYVYIDASHLDGVVSKAETFANNVLDGLNNSFVAAYYPAAILSFLDENGHLPLKQYWDSLFEGAEGKKISFYEGATGWLSDDDQSSLVSYLQSIDVVSLVEMANEVGIDTEFVVYKEGTFGFQLSLDKEGLFGIINNLLGESAESAASVLNIVSDAISNFEISAAFYFEDYLLQSASLAANVAVSVFDLGSFVPEESRESVALTGSISASLSGSISAEIGYNNAKVSFPDLSGYVLLENKAKSGPESSPELE